MKKVLIVAAFICLFTVPLRADAWDEVLAAAGTSRADCRFRADDFSLVASGEYRLPLFNALISEPLSGPFHARVMRTGLLNASPKAGDLTMYAGRRIGIGTQLNLLGDPLNPYIELAAKPDALLYALESVWKAGGSSMPDNERERLTTAIPSLPDDVARAAALLLNIELASLGWRNRGLEPVRKAGIDLKDAYSLLTGRTDTDSANYPRLQNLASAIDLKRLAVGGELTAAAADYIALTLGERKGTEAYSLTVDTPLGRVILNGSGNDTVDAKAANLLILDTGGNDQYASGAATISENHPVSVLVDLSGDDRYIADPGLESSDVAGFDGRKNTGAAPSFGAGVLGYGVLVDRRGNDVYRGLNLTQGSAVFGAGLLKDHEGDDTYDAYGSAQGSAEYGVGILHDEAGSDSYSCFCNAQGYAGPMGFGLLLDKGASPDTYTARDTPLDIPSAQTPEHNTSMAQGVACGRRADYLDGHSIAGGVGVLCDDGGNNTLTCGVFGQGTGYWMGVGMCLLGPGDDTVAGTWYVQGSSAHFAVGILDDTGGNDTRKATHNMAMGAGHDYSVGWLIDHAGNDTCDAPGLSLGGGNACGYGFYWDKAGDDSYKAQPRASMGDSGGGSRVNDLRERSVTMGVFLDSGGNDAYPTSIPRSRNNNIWSVLRNDRNGRGGERGGGLDTEAPRLAEPD